MVEGKGVREGRDEAKAGAIFDKRAELFESAFRLFGTSAGGARSRGKSREGGKHPEKTCRDGGARGGSHLFVLGFLRARARDEGARARVARGDARAEAGGGDGGAETEREGRHRGELSSFRRGAELATMKCLEASGGDDRAGVRCDNDENAANTRA